MEAAKAQNWAVEPQEKKKEDIENDSRKLNVKGMETKGK
jgi:hypothetical protein